MTSAWKPQGKGEMVRYECCIQGGAHKKFSMAPKSLVAFITATIKPLTHETLQSTFKSQTLLKQHFAEFQMQSEVGLNYLSCFLER